MPRLLMYLSASPISGSILRAESLVRILLRWTWGWEVMVRGPSPLPGWDETPALCLERTPLPEPPSSQDENRLREWVEEWVKGWGPWIEGEERVAREFRPTVILDDMAPQPLVLAHKLGIPGWFLGSFNWFAYLSQFIPLSAALDEVGLAYEYAQVAYVPPLSWGQGIFPLVQEVPLVGGTLDGEGVRAMRLQAMREGLPVYLTPSLRMCRGWLKELQMPLSWLEGREGLQAAQVAIVEAYYAPLTLALRGQTPCIVYHKHWEPLCSMAKEVESLGVGLAFQWGDAPSREELSALLNKAPEAYGSLPSLYRLDGAQFIVEQLESLVDREAGDAWD